ncbi:hypothetical protein [Robiginitalea aurantiaca]|uniref:Host attachment protein n=1 Tax=Robiginitalea aurantiaca TaxID=3056915 RepID=A0ABT7WCT8_9FLAO|nr:hypothetical protein [Robiginitalea aurantiaca]MDM9630713.1 hypothetical protein [Robiginitalea aurantiaca]
MKQIGVWMDKKEAHVVSVSEGKTEMKNLASDLEFFNPKGGSRSKTRWGPQQVVHDSRYTERENHQLREYYDTLARELKDAEAIVLYGPAGTKADFKKRLDEAHPDIGMKVRDVLTADSMTPNQVKALILGYFES